jgi:hypothetical protein
MISGKVSVCGEKAGIREVTSALCKQKLKSYKERNKIYIMQCKNFSNYSKINEHFRGKLRRNF